MSSYPRALLATVLGGLAFMAWPATGTSLAADSPIERYRQALEQPVSVDFQGATLDVVLATLRDKTRLQFVFDADRNNPAGPPYYADEITVTMKHDNVKLRTLLRSLLAPRHLNWAFLPEEEAVVVSSPARVTDRLLGQHVDLDWRGRPLAEALAKLGQDFGVNVVLDPRQAELAKAPQTLRLTEVPLEAAVRLAAETAGLKAVRVANVLLVTSRETAAELQREEDRRAESDAARPPAGAATPAPAGSPVPPDLPRIR
jgi:hypothetical protein